MQVSRLIWKLIAREWLDEGGGVRVAHVVLINHFSTPTGQLLKDISSNLTCICTHKDEEMSHLLF